MCVKPSIEEALARFDRVTLTRTPTPLDLLRRVTADLGPDVYLKRDDLTDLALGGDKPRKLEYELALALAEGATIVVTCGSAQSNHARLTAAAARKLGLEAAVVLNRDELTRFQGNLLVVQLLGADVHFVESDDHWALREHALQWCAALRADGHRPYFIPVSGTTPYSCLGYVRAGLEWVDQIEALQVVPDAVYLPFGTGGIFTGVLLALRERGIECPVIGISVNRKEQQCRENLARWWSSLCTLMDRDPDQTQQPFEIHDQFVGKHYGDPTQACLDAIVHVAEAEGILLDPVYSGKMCSGFRAHCAAGRWTAGQTVMLLHSGGVPALFAYRDHVWAHLVDRGRSVAPLPTADDGPGG